LFPHRRIEGKKKKGQQTSGRPAVGGKKEDETGGNRKCPSLCSDGRKGTSGPKRREREETSDAPATARAEKKPSLCADPQREKGSSSQLNGGERTITSEKDMREMNVHRPKLEFFALTKRGRVRGPWWTGRKRKG